ncbi:MAG: hypothetical protein EOO68_06060 [Moraxellaceae bacterium]|nr:MAG: hypothetical protein EOO68_06060 [Moraxellaceae bacterium]
MRIKMVPGSINKLDHTDEPTQPHFPKGSDADAVSAEEYGTLWTGSTTEQEKPVVAVLLRVCLWFMRQKTDLLAA